jgi:hypothetical protein
MKWALGEGMQDQLTRFAYEGQWKDVLALLGQRPDLANAASTGKGYWQMTVIPLLARRAGWLQRSWVGTFD